MASASTNVNTNISSLYMPYLDHLLRQDKMISKLKNDYSIYDKMDVEKAATFYEPQGITGVFRSIKDKIVLETKEVGGLFIMLTRIAGYVGVCFAMIGMLFKRQAAISVGINLCMCFLLGTKEVGTLFMDQMLTRIVGYVGIYFTLIGMLFKRQAVISVGNYLCRFFIISNVISVFATIYIKDTKTSTEKLQRMESTLKDKIQVVQLGLQEFKTKVHELKANPLISNATLNEEITVLAKRIQQTVEEVKKMVDVMHRNTILPKVQKAVLWEERKLLSDVARTVNACNPSRFSLSPCKLWNRLVR